MSSLFEDIQMMDQPVERAVELLWHDAMMHLEATNNEVILPYNVVDLIGDENVAKIAERLSTLLAEECHPVRDANIQSVRILPYCGQHSLSMKQHQQLSRAVHKAAFNGMKIPQKSEKVPRPANSFILFRQNRHHAIKAANPGITNNEISKIVGKEWRVASPEVKAQFKALADELKRQHAIDHPDYQYAPRRPSEKRRRRVTPRVAAHNLPFLHHNVDDLEYLNSVTSDDGTVEVDEDFLDVLEKHGFFNNATGVEPISVPDNNSQFYAIVNEQLDGQEIESLVYDPLVNQELDHDNDFSTSVADFE